MNKALSLAAAGVGGGGTAAGGYYLATGNFFGGGSKDSKATEASSTTTTEEPSATTTTDAIEEFKKSNKENNCIKTVFSDQGISFNTQDSSTLPSNINDFFGTKPAGDQSTKSCLEIKWEKSPKSGDKWSGSFTWLWTFSHKEKGFAVIQQASSTTANKMSLIGAFYLLEKESGKDTWKVSYQKEIKEGKEITQDNFDNHFPKSNLESTPTSKPHWGFVTDKNDLAKICENNTCSSTTESTPTKSTYEFKWNNTGTKKVHEWSSDLKWWESMYKTSDANTLDLKTKLDSFTGEWTATEGK